MNKLCKICGETKNIDDFYFRKDAKNYRNECKQCFNNQCKNRMKDENRLKKRKEYDKLYRETHKEEAKKYKKEYYIKNKDEISIKQKNNYIKNIDERRANNKKYYQTHKEEQKQYRENNKEHYRKIAREYNKRRKEEDKVFYFKTKARKFLLDSFKRKKYKKKGHTKDIIGCSSEKFTSYLLQTYIDNYGYEWDGIEKVHIDHKKPLKLAATEEDVIRLCHYTNLQLLKAEDNLKKSCKYEVDNGNNENISDSDNNDESDITNMGTNKTKEDNKN